MQRPACRDQAVTGHTGKLSSDLCSSLQTQTQSTQNQCSHWRRRENKVVNESDQAVASGAHAQGPAAVWIIPKEQETTVQTSTKPDREPCSISCHRFMHRWLSHQVLGCSMRRQLSSFISLEEEMEITSEETPSERKARCWRWIRETEMETWKLRSIYTAPGETVWGDSSDISVLTMGFWKQGWLNILLSRVGFTPLHILWKKCIFAKPVWIDTKLELSTSTGGNAFTFCWYHS